MLPTVFERSLIGEFETFYDDLKERCQDKPVRMLKGKYIGRLATIDGLLWDRIKGFQYCCMIERLDGSGPLNSDNESRSYYSSDWFTFDI